MSINLNRWRLTLMLSDTLLRNLLLTTYQDLKVSY